MAVPAISVRVVDSVSGTDLSHATTVRARDGAFVDSIITAGPAADTSALAIALAFERSGDYQVSVSHMGYHDWITTGVQVTRGNCHVRTANLVARLVPAP